MKPFGFGIDILNMNRTEFDDPKFAKRYMTKFEYNCFVNSGYDRQYMCGIWCLKEAIIKAINHKIVFSKITIEFTSEAPICKIDGLNLFLSISYEKDLAVAIAISFPTNENE